MEHVQTSFRERITLSLLSFFRAPIFFFIWLLTASIIGILLLAAAISFIVFLALLLLAGPFSLFAIAKAAEYAIFLFFSMSIVGIGVALISSIKGHLGTTQSVIKALNIETSGSGSLETQMIANLAKEAGLKATPTVGVYSAEDVNALASGTRASNSLIAFSSGLLNKFDAEAVQAVAAHEVAHIANKDMIRMQLARAMQKGLVAGFFIAPVKNFLRYTAFFASELMLKNLSRKREYAADAMAAELVGAASMQHALKQIEGSPEKDTSKPASKFQSLMISSRGDSWFSTHPTLSNRIRALEKPTTKEAVFPYPSAAAKLTILSAFLATILTGGAFNVITFLAACIFQTVIAIGTHFFGRKREVINALVFLVICLLVMACVDVVMRPIIYGLRMQIYLWFNLAVMLVWVSLTYVLLRWLGRLAVTKLHEYLERNGNPFSTGPNNSSLEP